MGLKTPHTLSGSFLAYLALQIPKDHQAVNFMHSQHSGGKTSRHPQPLKDQICMFSIPGISNAYLPK